MDVVKVKRPRLSSPPASPDTVRIAVVLWLRPTCRLNNRLALGLLAQDQELLEDEGEESTPSAIERVDDVDDCKLRELNIRDDGADSSLN